MFCLFCLFYLYRKIRADLCNLWEVNIYCFMCFECFIYIEISVAVGSVFGNHLAVGPKSKFARHKGRSLQMSFTEGTSSIFANFIVFGNIIIVAVVFAELVRLLPFIFDIKVVVFIGFF